jgi:hypothetical protein
MAACRALKCAHVTKKRPQRTAFREDHFVIALGTLAPVPRRLLRFECQLGAALMARLNTLYSGRALVTKLSHASQREANTPKQENSTTITKGRDFVSALAASRIRTFATIEFMTPSSQSLTC